MRQTLLCGVLLVTLMLFSVWAAAAAEAPVAVSPGDALKLALIEERCPTFSWSVVAGAKKYELMVYRVGEESEEPTPVFRRSFAGSASSWTPSLDQCLERGGQYGWSVRGVGRKASSWSPPSLFQVASGPTEEELEAALAIVTEYREEQRAAQEVPRAVEGLDDGSPVPNPASAASGSRRSESSSARDGAFPSAAALLASLALSLDDNLQITTGNTPSLRLDQDGSGAFTPQTWDVKANEQVFFVRDATAETNPLAIEVGAPTDSLRIRADGMVEAQFAGPDPPCFNNTRRFVNCANGTVTDSLTGLIWLENASCFAAQDYQAANVTVAALFDGSTNDPTGGDCGLTDGSRRGDWRLPSKGEWRMLYPRTSCGSAPRIVGNGNGPAGNGCYTDSAWAVDVLAAAYYWSSTSSRFNSWTAHIMGTSSPGISTSLRTDNRPFWPVRGGHGVVIPSSIDLLDPVP